MSYKLHLGIQQDLNHQIPAVYKLDDRFHHSLIIGKTGMGKSVLMERMAAYDISQGISVIYMDPKGDSVKRLYHLADQKPKYVSIDHPLVINPLKKKGYQLTEIIAEFVQIIEILITLTSPANVPPTTQMREIIGMVMKALKDEDKNLDFLVKFLIYEKVRYDYRKNIKNNDVLIYWEEFDAFDRHIRRNKEKIESAKRVASRLLEICDGRMMDFVIGENELNIAELLQKKQSLLVNTSRMSRPARIYLSNLIIYSVISYMNFEAKHEHPLIVYVDEFQMVVSQLFADILRLGRGTQVGFVLAHHDFEEIKKEILGSVFGNVNLFIAFRCGLKEAQYLAETYGLKARDFLDLEKYQAWIRSGKDNTLIQTYAPLLTEIPKISLPAKDISMQINFLRDAWIEN